MRVDPYQSCMSTIHSCRQKGLRPREWRFTERETRMFHSGVLAGLSSKLDHMDMTVAQRDAVEIAAEGADRLLRYLMDIQDALSGGTPHIGPRPRDVRLLHRVFQGMV